MKHLGDITKIHGYDVPRTEVVIGGSPCQDLSVAGLRAGLGGERSGLFMEQIRIIKEMRERDKANGRTDTDVYPRYMVWENVPGAFSSNKGEDFRTVLEETARIAEKTVSIPRYEGRQWANAGAIIGDGWSLAWRLHNAQYWGVPQRRKRIALVADFGGLTAPEILFESESLFGDSAAGGEARERTPGDFAGGVGETGGAMNPWDPQSERVYGADGVWHSLNANESGGQSRDAVCYGFKLGQGEKAYGMAFEQEIAPTLNAECGGNKPAVLCGVDLYNGTIADEVAATLGASSGNANTVGPKVLAFSQNGSGDVVVSENCYSLSTRQNPCGRGTGMIFGFQPQAGGNTGCAIGYDCAPCLGVTQKPAVYDARGNGDGRTVPTITEDHENRITDYTAVCVGNGQANNTKLHEKAPALSTMHDQQAVMAGSVVRRLTPLECERLQGYPDGWTDIGDWTDSKGKKRQTSDAARYRALGNSIALPFWQWMLGQMIGYCKDGTMASLFDGIGGFPLCWLRVGGRTLWASEIEEYPIAVTKYHFGEN